MQIRALIVGGPMKTGSTALALGLTALAKQNLLPDGLVYPIDHQWEQRFSGKLVQKHHLIKAASRPIQTSGQDELRILLSALVGDLREQNAATGLITVVFVWEGCARRFVGDSQSAKTFLTFMDEFFDEVAFTFTLRDQRYALASLAQQIVRGDRPMRDGRDILVRPPHLRVDSRLAKAYDPKLIWESMARVGLAETTWFRVFEERSKSEPYVLTDFLGHLGFSEVDVSRGALGPAPVHQSVSCFQFLMLLLFSRYLRYPLPGKKLVWALRKSFNRYTVKPKKNLRSRSKGFLCQMSSRESALVEEYFLGSNQFIAERLGRLPEDSWLSTFRTLEESSSR